MTLFPPLLNVLADFDAGDLFRKPLPVWNSWPWLLVPLVVGIAVVYKSVKCKSMKQVPREAGVLTLWIVVGIVVAATVLAGVVRVLER